MLWCLAPTVCTNQLMQLQPCQQYITFSSKQTHCSCNMETCCLHQVCGWGSPSSTLPHTDGQSASKEHVEDVLQIVSDLHGVALSHHCVPRTTKLLVHCLFDELGCKLQKAQAHLVTPHTHIHIHMCKPTSLLLPCFSQAVTQSSIASMRTSSFISEYCTDGQHSMHPVRNGFTAAHFNRYAILRVP